MDEPANASARVLGLLATLPLAEPPSAQDRPSAAPAGVCAACGGLFSAPGLELDPGAMLLRCAACQAAARRRVGLTWLVWLAGQPVTWVILLVALAAGLYLAGVGRPDAPRVRILDQRRPPWRQEWPRQVLAQAERVELRLRLLAAYGPAADSARWAALGLAAWQTLAEPAVWGQTSVAPSLRLGQARLLARQGQWAAAEPLLKALRADFPETIRGWQVQRYWHGLAAWHLGRQAEAAALWDEVLVTVSAERPPDRSALIDELLRQQTLGFEERAWQDRVAAAAGLHQAPTRVALTLLHELTRLNALTPTAQALIKRWGGLPVMPPEFAPSTVVAPADEPLVERFHR